MSPKSVDYLRDALTFDESHRIVMNSSFVTHEKRIDDVRVMQGGRCLSFILESL